MNKRIFTIFLIAALLIVSAGVISAADNQDDSSPISVKINWDDAAKVSERPSQVKVDLIKDGSVVDTVVLKESNSWKATFKSQSADGTFKVRSSDLNDYSMGISGDADVGFVITYSLNADVLGASEDESAVQDAAPSEDDSLQAVDPADDSPVGQDNESGDDTNTSDELDNETDAEEEFEDTNATDDAAADGEEADDDLTEVDSAPTTTSQKAPDAKEKQVQKTDKKPVKKHKIPKSKLRNTGLPIVALVIVLGIVSFVPFSRKK